MTAIATQFMSTTTSVTSSTPYTSTSSSSSTSTSSSTSSSTSTTSTAKPNMLIAMGAGSGVDTKALAQNLVEAERAPQKAAIDARINKSQAAISGYAGMSYALSNFKDTFAKLQTADGFNAVSAQSYDPSAFNATVSSSATAGNHTILVNTLAQPQRGTLGPLANSGLSGNLTFTVNGGTAVTVAVGSTPAQTVSAINSTANLGVQAQLINTSADSNNPVYQIILTSTNSGSANSFTVDSTVSGASYTALNSAQDAEMVVDGLTVKRSTNTVKDVINGVTLQLSGVSTNGTSTLALTRDTSVVKQNITDLVSAFNFVNSTLDTISDPKSSDTTIGATLPNNSLVRQVRQQVLKMVTENSSTPGTNIKALRDLGIAIQRDGTLKIEDPTKLDDALQSNYADIEHMFSNDAFTASTSSAVSSGLAGDAVKKLAELTSPTGIIATQSKNASNEVNTGKDDLAKLEDRMSKLLDRYTQQFAAMDSLMAQMNSLKAQLKSTFDGMSAKNN